MMKRSFISNLFFLVLMNLLVKPFYIFGIDAEVQRQVGTAVYGNYFALLNLSFIFNIVLDLGISNYNIRSTASGNNEHKTIARGLLGVKSILILPYFILSTALAFFIGIQNEEWTLLLILLCNQVFVGFIAFFRSHLSGNLFFKSDSLVSVLDRLLLIAICVWLLYANTSGQSFKIEYFVYAQFAAYGLTAILSGVLVRFNRIKLIFQWDKKQLLPILKKSLPFALLTLLMMVYTRTDSIMLEALHSKGNEEAGIYAMGFRWLDAFNMFALLFTVILLPLFSKHLNEVEKLKSILQQGVKLLLPFSFFLALICFFHAESILSLRYTENLQEAIPSFRLLMFCFPLMCFTYLFGTLITAQNKLLFLNQISLFTLILNIGLNLLLIPSYGAAGAATATLFTQGLVGFIQCWKVVEDLHFKKILTVFLSTAIMLALCAILNFSLLGKWSFLELLTLSTLIYIASAFLFKWIVPKEIIRLSQQ